MVGIFSLRLVIADNSIKKALRLVVLPVLLLTTHAAADENAARGLVKAKSRAVLASEIGAIVSQTPLRAGDSFKEGDLLIGFDCRLLKNQRDKVAAQVKASKARLDNAKDLEKMRSIGKLEVTLARAEYDKNRSELKIATLNVERCTVKAPFGGTVVQLLVNRYESVDLRRSLIEIASSSQLEIEIIAPTGWLSLVSNGQKAKMRVDELQADIELEIIAVGGAIDPVSQTILVRCKVLNRPANLLPGMSGLVVL